MVQRQIAAELEVDTAYISKVENEEKPLSKLHITKLAKFCKISEKELLQMWLADKIYELLNDEDNAADVLDFVKFQVDKKTTTISSKSLSV